MEPDTVNTSLLQIGSLLAKIGMSLGLAGAEQLGDIAGILLTKPDETGKATMLTDPQLTKYMQQGEAVSDEEAKHLGYVKTPVNPSEVYAKHLQGLDFPSSPVVLQTKPAGPPPPIHAVSSVAGPRPEPIPLTLPPNRAQTKVFLDALGQKHRRNLILPAEESDE